MFGLVHLTTLPIASPAFNDSPKYPCMSGTRVKTLQDLRSDLMDDRFRVVWLESSPGKGKSAIAKSLWKSHQQNPCCILFSTTRMAVRSPLQKHLPTRLPASWLDCHSNSGDCPCVKSQMAPSGVVLVLDALDESRDQRELTRLVR